MTLQDKLIQGLLRLNFKEVHPPRQGRKYRIFASPTGVNYVFVGKNGALRTGKSATVSRQCTETFRALVLSTPPNDVGF